MPSATPEVRPVVELRRLDASVANRTHEYPGLANGTKVLVTTGGTIADATISQLSAAGCLVTTLSLLEVEQGVGGVLISPESCMRAVDGQEVVVHAGQVADKCSSEVDASRHVVAGTKLLLEAAAAAGSVKAFVFASSARCGCAIGVPCLLAYFLACLPVRSVSCPCLCCRDEICACTHPILTDSQ